MFKIASRGNIFVLTKAGYDRTPDKVKSERAVGEPVKGYEDKVPASWVRKGYVCEARKA